MIPNDSRATLGKAILAMEAAPTKWMSPLNEDGVQAAIGMMKALWRGQRRHGMSDRAATVSPDEAETAVQLAVTLVRLFTSGGIARVA